VTSNFLVLVVKTPTGVVTTMKPFLALAGTLVTILVAESFFTVAAMPLNVTTRPGQVRTGDGDLGSRWARGLTDPVLLPLRTWQGFSGSGSDCIPRCRTV
jgi:hypothetical protein